MIPNKAMMTLDNFLLLYNSKKNEEDKDMCSEDIAEMVFQEMEIVNPEEKQILYDTTVELEKPPYPTNLEIAEGLRYGFTGTCAIALIGTLISHSVLTGIGIGIPVGIAFGYIMHHLEKKHVESELSHWENSIKENACKRLENLFSGQRQIEPNPHQELLARAIPGANEIHQRKMIETGLCDRLYRYEVELDEKGIPKDKKYIN